MKLSERRPIRGMEATDGGGEGTPAVEDHALRSLFPVVPGNYLADLDSIIISTGELDRRSSRPPDHAAESQALLALAHELATSPGGILQKLAESALSLCRAQSACVSLLDDTRKNFYWPAVAGQWAPYLGAGAPRDFGPCGTVLDRDVPLLFSHPERLFTYLSELQPYVEEGLLFPFHVDGQAVGTIWVVNHDHGRQFDAEDMRVLGQLADFAAAAYQSYLASTKVRDSERHLRQIIDVLPAAIYTTDAEGRVTMFNEAAATFAGRTPQLGTDSWCVTWRLFWPDGTPMPHDQCPMATAVKERRPVRGMEGIVERPDGTRRRFIPYPTPLFDSSGAMVGAVNMAVDITDSKLAEEAITRHRDEQAALYAFTDRLFRAASLQDIYDAALEAICQVLGCERASILLFDDAGVMRFVAWTGLSEQYRRAIEGHSPWTRKVRDPQPICIADVDASDLPGSPKAAVKAEGIAATAFFPLMIDGELVGKFMAYYAAPHTFDQIEINLAVTIARQLGFSLERRRAEQALRATQRQLVSELAATRQLQEISTQLIHASDAQVLHEKILDAAVAILRSDFASMQLFYPERGELRLLAYRGFNPTAAAFWEWVRPGSASTCGAALATGARSIVPDIELSDFMAGSEDLETYRQTGIRAVQSTPLICRAGHLLGMISTHWRNPHQPSERDLRLLDVLARQAADLIERKQAELTDQRLAAIVDSSHDAIVSKNLNGIITIWNRGAERLFGYAASEMIGRSITTLIPPDRHHEEVRILDRIRRGERVDPYETLRQRADGSLVDVSVSVSPLRNSAGEVVGASKIARDITERKKAELALAERNLQVALAERAALVGSVAYDADSEKFQISAGFAAIHGFPAGTREITRSEWKAGVHHDDRERLEDLRNHAFRTRSNEYSVDFRIVRADEVRWIDARIFVSYREDGDPQRVVGINIDVTARKRAEEHQRTLRAELDHRVKNILAAVSAIAAHTKDSSSSMDDFVAALDSRIRSMASTHQLLSSSRWQGVPLRELLRRELAPYTSNSNTCIEGLEVILRPEAAQTTASVLHELTTNAAKYGALSKREGRVSVRWHCAPNGQAPGPLAIEWVETGGPPVKVPSNCGYGRSVITELVSYELGGTARLLFSPEGVRCQLDIPAIWLAPVATEQENGAVRHEGK
jgi:PAS domain S-box-containing protein